MKTALFALSLLTSINAFALTCQEQLELTTKGEKVSVDWAYDCKATSVESKRTNSALYILHDRVCLYQYVNSENQTKNLIAFFPKDTPKANLLLGLNNQNVDDRGDVLSIVDQEISGHGGMIPNYVIRNELIIKKKDSKIEAALNISEGKFYLPKSYKLIGKYNCK